MQSWHHFSPNAHALPAPFARLSLPRAPSITVAPRQFARCPGRVPFFDAKFPPTPATMRLDVLFPIPPGPSKVLRACRTFAESRFRHRKEWFLRFLAVPALLCLALVGNLPARASPLSDSNFYVHALGSRCFSLGNPQAWIAQNHIPVVLRNCAPLLSQRIRVEEIDATTHDILLHPPGSPLCIGVAVPAGEKPAPGQELELQTCDTSGAQRFAFDGDALLVGIQDQGMRNSRDYVVKPAGSSTAVGTHLVIDVRKLDDAEFLRMDATNGTGRRPTSGFIRVASEIALDAALAGAGWGTVIEVTASIDLQYAGKLLPAGSTLRGDRKFTNNGPNLRFQSTLENAEIFALEDSTRITGLRLTGPTRSDNTSIKKISAISVSSAFQALPRCQDRCRLPLGGCVGGWGITDPGLCALRGQPGRSPKGD